MLSLLIDEQMQVIGGGLTVYRACVYLMTSALTSCALALVVLYLHYSASILAASASKLKPHNTDSHSALCEFFAARRSALARHLLWRRGCLSDCVCHVVVLCLNDLVDNHETFTAL